MKDFIQRKLPNGIDKEINYLIKEAARRAEIVIRANRACIEKLKDVLLDKETVEEKEILEIFRDSHLPAELKEQAP